jgi:hypothetical protein
VAVDIRPDKRAQYSGGAVDSGQPRVDKPTAKAKKEKGTDPRIIEQQLRDAQAICWWSQCAPGKQGVRVDRVQPATYIQILTGLLCVGGQFAWVVRAGEKRGGKGGGEPGG